MAMDPSSKLTPLKGHKDSLLVDVLERIGRKIIVGTQGTHPGQDVGEIPPYRSREGFPNSILSGNPFLEVESDTNLSIMEL